MINQSLLNVDFILAEYLGRIPFIKRLELIRCHKLESDSGLEDVAVSLRRLGINHSRRFKVGHDLRSLQNIEVLCLNSCGELEDLEFLHDFPRLIDFRFVDTNVRSGDLTPLLAACRT